MPCLLAVVVDWVLDFSLLDLRELFCLRECDEDGLSRGDFGGGMPSPLDIPPTRFLAQCRSTPGRRLILKPLSKCLAAGASFVLK